MPTHLGEFEQLVLLAILHLGDDVYGVPIAEEIERRTGKPVATAENYVRPLFRRPRRVKAA